MLQRPEGRRRTPRTGAFGRSAVRWGRGGDRATDQAPEARRPNAAQSVVPGGEGPTPVGLRPPSLWGVVDRAGSGASAPPRPPFRAPGGETGCV